MTMSLDLILLLVGFFLSLFTFSLVLGDNWLFRISASLLAGTLSAYLLIILVESVFIPLVIQPLVSPEASRWDKITLILVLLAAALLFIKSAFHRKAAGNLVLALVVCVVTAVTILGVVNGTLVNLYRGLLAYALPAQDAPQPTLYWLRFFLLFLGVITSLLYSQHYISRRAGEMKGSDENRLNKAITFFGEVFIGIAFGAIFAGCFIASATILIEQIAQMLSASSEILQWVK